MRIPSRNDSLLLLFPQLFNQTLYSFVDPCLPYRIVEGWIPPELGQLAPDRYETSAPDRYKTSALSRYKALPPTSFLFQGSAQVSIFVSEFVIADDDFHFD
jgi:hypothetical protein